MNGGSEGSEEERIRIGKKKGKMGEYKGISERYKGKRSEGV